MELNAIDGLMESSYSVVFDNHGFTGDFQAYAKLIVYLKEPLGRF